MAETLNKRIMPALAAEARENARRYWAQKTARPPATPTAEVRAMKPGSAPATDEKSNLPREDQ